MNEQYVIARINGNESRELCLEQILWEPDCGVRAGGRIRHDGEGLLVSLWAKEKNIRAEYTTIPAPVHEDSCLEFFFMPEKENRYLNFEINPNGCLHIGFGRDRNDREQILPEDPKTMFRIRTEREPEGWTAAYRIPAAFLDSCYPGFRFSGMLRANVYKCGDRTIHPHYLAWNPIVSSVPDFHRPECFGSMVFE